MHTPPPHHSQQVVCNWGIQAHVDIGVDLVLLPLKNQRLRCVLKSYYGFYIHCVLHSGICSNYRGLYRNVIIGFLIYWHGRLCVIKPQTKNFPVVLLLLHFQLACLSMNCEECTTVSSYYKQTSKIAIERCEKGEDCRISESNLRDAGEKWDDTFMENFNFIARLSPFPLNSSARVFPRDHSLSRCVTMTVQDF